MPNLQDLIQDQLRWLHSRGIVPERIGHAFRKAMVLPSGPLASVEISAVTFHYYSLPLKFTPGHEEPEVLGFDDQGRMTATLPGGQVLYARHLEVKGEAKQVTCFRATWPFIKRVSVMDVRATATLTGDPEQAGLFDQQMPLLKLLY